MWNWNEVFKILVQNCDKQGSESKLTIHEVVHLKNGPVGEGWGEYNLRKNIFGIYRKKYPNYEFGIRENRKYIWCKHK